MVDRSRAAPGASTRPVRPRRRGRALPSLTGRAVARVGRQPSVWIPVLAFPLLFSAVLTSALSSAAGVLGSTVDGSYLSFSIPATLLQATVLAAVACGTGRAEDIETRFDHLLRLSPISRAMTPISHILCGAAVSGAAAVVLLGVFELFDGTPPSGQATSLAVVVLYTLLGAGFSGLVVALATWTGSVQSVLATYPSIMLLTFFSTALVPRELMAPWFAAIATRNPISWILADVRDLYSEAWSTPTYLGTLGLAVALCAGAGLLVVRATRRRAVA
jgi:ABC-2 type transport system permease protein